MNEISVKRASVDDLAALRSLWLALHAHHREIVSFDLQTDDGLSWDLRSKFYREVIEGASGFVLVAINGAETVGYACVLVRPGGPDDTFASAGSTGEIYSLVVASSHRNTGVGSTIVAAAQSELSRRGIVDVNVRVMTTNDATLRFYGRHGFVPVETSLWSFGSLGVGEGELAKPATGSLNVRRATPLDRHVVHSLVREFYEIDRHQYDEQHIDGALVPLLTNDSFGQIWLAVDDGGIGVGYAVVTWSFSLESGGRDCILDEIYVRDRGSGLGGVLLERALHEARAAGARAVFLETEKHNRQVASFYRRHGFIDDDSIWMSRSL